MSNLRLNLIKYKANSYVIISGDTNNNHFFIIQDGKVRITKNISSFDNSTEEEILSKGDFFGVISCMSNFPRIQTAFTLTPTVLISINKADFPLLIQKSPQIPLKIIKKFSNDLRIFDKQITQRNVNSYIEEREDEVLFKNGEYYLERNNYNYAYKIFLSYIKDYPDGTHVEEAKQNAVKIKPYINQDQLKISYKGLTAFVPKNFLLFSEGQKGEKLYIIQKGGVNITKILDNKEVLIAVLKEGDIFGEMALLEDKPRTASAITNSDSVFLVVDRKNFSQMVATQPSLTTKLITLLAERLWIAYRQLENTLIDDPLGKIWDTLLIQLQKHRVEIIPKKTFKFPFTFKELVKMVGLSEFDVVRYKNEIYNTKKFEEQEGKIFCKDVSVIEKQVEYYKKMIKIKQKLKKKDAGVGFEY